MSDEKGFLRAIRQSPGDASLRAVYADWLEERGDSRAEYLRLVCELEGPAGVGRGAQNLRDRLHQLHSTAEAAWVDAVTPTWATLRYHWRTFALLGEQPVVSKVNLRKIERWESRSGFRIPASLREWYSLAGAEERLRDGTQLFAPNTLQRALNLTSRSLPAPGQWFSVGHWLSGGENTVRIAEPVDPVLFWSARHEDRPFSQFAFDRCWSRLTHADVYRFEEESGAWEDYAQGSVGPEFPLVWADEPALGRRETAYLADHFMEGHHRLVNGRWREGIHPITRAHVRWFGPTSVLRYFGPGVRIQVICMGNPEKRATQAHWDISADTVATLVAAVKQHLWNRGTLARTLSSPTEAGQAALKALRR